MFSNIKITLHYSVYMPTSGEKVCISDEAECVQSVSYSQIRYCQGYIQWCVSGWASEALASYPPFQGPPQGISHANIPHFR